VLDIDPPTRPRDQRFVRYANAITQAEIRRLSSSQPTAHVEPDGRVGTVRQELRPGRVPLAHEAAPRQAGLNGRVSPAAGVPARARRAGRAG
jgi:hypothetical protein